MINSSNVSLEGLEVEGSHGVALYVDNGAEVTLSGA